MSTNVADELNSATPLFGWTIFMGNPLFLAFIGFFLLEASIRRILLFPRKAINIIAKVKYIITFSVNGTKSKMMLICSFYAYVAYRLAALIAEDKGQEPKQ